VRPLLSSVRRKIFGETGTIPLGVASAVVLALLLRMLIPNGEWRVVGGFVLAAAVITTLVRSLPADTRRRGARRSAAQPQQPTTTRTDE
jgi:hypothetical protein